MLDPDQALLTGQIGELLMTLNRDDPESLLELEIERDEAGNYTNRIFVTRPSGVYVVSVEGPAKGLPPRARKRTAD